MGKRGFPDSGYVFKQEMATSQESHKAHFDHMRFPFDHPRNIFLDGLNGLRCIHDGTTTRNRAVEWRDDRTRSKSNKGSKNGQSIHVFERL
jgi:hypothetical protein